MKKTSIKIVLVAMLFSACLLSRAEAQQRDVLGVHDLSAGTSPMHGDNANACLYCHAPHSGQKNGPLWSHEFSKKTYSSAEMYTSDTVQNTPASPTIGSDSTLCLSCHDGTVALGQTLPYGTINMSAAMGDPMANLNASHPFSLVAAPPADASSLVSSLHSTGSTADQTKAVKLVKNNVECTSCHEPHRQNIDTHSQNFLSKDNAKGALCFACHTTEARTVNSLPNPLVGWAASAHVTTAAAYKPSAGLGGYETVADSACISCHVTHDAGGAKGLLRHSSVSATNADDASQSCINCHNGGSDKLAVSILNIYSEITTKKSHPFPNSDNLHKPNEATVLDSNRHASCVDCHNAHASKEMGTGSYTAAPGLRASQFSVTGAAMDGSNMAAAVNQYENCLRCHGNSVGKAKQETTYGYLPSRVNWGGDELNLIVQMGSTATSSHPVMRDAYPNASLQPSLLNSMLTLTGTASTRTLQPGPVRIFCTDCHNNDQNGEFGGTGPNGPHGSVYDHILERDYTISRVNEGGATWPSGGPGTPIINLASFSTPYPTTSGAFPLCAKCHDLNNVASDVSFTKHSFHLNKGFSCSVCHTAHGVPLGGSSGAGRRLINFDARVVAPNGTTTSYNADGTCSLTCHMARHYDNGGVQGIEVLTSASPRPF